MKNKTLHKKLGKFIGYIFLNVFILLGGLVVYLKFIVRDIPPIDDSDMKIVEKSVPEKENAYPLIIQTVGYMRGSSKTQFAKDLWKALDNIKNGVPINEKQFYKDVNKFKKQLDAIEQISKMKYAKGPQLNKPTDPQPNYLRIMELSKLRNAIAKHDFSNGNKDEAFTTVLDMARLGRLVEQPDGGSSLINTMIGIAVKNIALLAINDFLDTGYLPDKSLNATNELSNIYESDSVWTNSMKHEYLLLKPFVQNYSYKDIGFINSLIYKQNRLIMLSHDIYTSRIKESTGKSVSEIKPFQFEFTPAGYPAPRLVRLIFDSGLSFNRSMFFLSMGFTDILSTAINKKFNSDCFIDLTRLRLAILGYQNDHGELPESLNNLVPKYIDVLPNDRFDGKNLHYDRKRKIIYSVGMNFKDDKGSYKNTILDKPSWKDIRKEKDIVLRIEK
jgi:hypothetical protein